MGKTKRVKKKKEQGPTGLLSVKDAEAEIEAEEMDTVNANCRIGGTIGAIVEKVITVWHII